MLLQRLVEYAQRLNLPPPLYNEAPVRYIIELAANGRLLNRAPIDTADPANGRTRRGEPHRVPQVQRTNVIRPLLLADRGDYTLGLIRPDDDPERAVKRHRAYLELLVRCAAATGEPAVQAVVTFLQNDPLAQLTLSADFDPGALITFRVGSTFPVDLPAVQGFWALENDPEARAAAVGTTAPVMQCLVCGQHRPVLARLQAKIKGIPGGQPAGTALISANADAFLSYGLAASLIAPTCAACGEQFTKAINALITGPTTHLALGGLVFLFWTRAQVDFFFYEMMADPQPDQIRNLLDAVRTGYAPPAFDDVAFYATALSANGGRVVVRDWIDTTVGMVRRQLARWFAQQAIVGAYGGPPHPLGLYALAAATVRDPRTDLAPPTPRALLRAALTGTPLPLTLLVQAVRRAPMKRPPYIKEVVSPQHAALIKLVLCSNHLLPEEDSMVQLNLMNTDPAYLCGRLLAVLEQAQAAAIPGLNTTLVDRFYGTASSAPATVFGRLLRGAQAHLARLEREKPGTYHALQRRLEEIQSGLSSFPRTLTLQDQGLFALGYYHQRAADRAAALAARAQKANGRPADQENSPNNEEINEND